MAHNSAQIGSAGSIRPWLEELLHSRHAVIAGRGEYGFAQCHRLQVVASADLRFAPAFEGYEELSHRSDECVGEPNVGPSRLLPGWIARDGVIERARRACRVARPADLPAGHPFRPFHAPAD